MSDFWDIFGRSALGSTFKRLVARMTMPQGARSGQQRMVWGANTPPELQAYGITNAMISYVVDPPTRPNPGVEVGYFFMGVSNDLDGAPGFRTMVFGNVTYPTPGVPSSATAANVFTNFQQDSHGQTSSLTIFKDGNVVCFPTVPALQLPFGTDFQMGYAGASLFSVGRGFEGRFVSVQTDSAAVNAAVTDMTDMQILGTIKSGRAYEAIISGKYTPSTTTNQLVLRLHEYSVGVDVMQFGGFPTSPGTLTVPVQGSCFFRRTGADLAGDFVPQIFSSVGAATVIFNGGSLAPRSFGIRDIGAAADYPTMLTL